MNLFQFKITYKMHLINHKQKFKQKMNLNVLFLIPIRYMMDKYLNIVKAN